MNNNSQFYDKNFVIKEIAELISAMIKNKEEEENDV